jgi:LacI family transcriptional regulator
MQKALSEHGYNMLFASNEDDPERELREIELFTAHRVAGLVIAPTSHGERYAEKFATAIRTPAVLVDRVIQGSSLDAVTDDNYLGAKLVTNYLLRLGHRDISFLVGRPGISPSDERYDGFCKSMTVAGHTVRQDLMHHSIYLKEHAFAAVQQLMTLPAPPTAIVCINMAQLLGTMAGLSNMGLRVPEDVSVVSFDGFHPAEGWHPTITSLSQDIEEISRRAADILLSRIERKMTHDPQIIRVAPTLNVRSSCAPLA